jgi:hypothetical protein
MERNDKRIPAKTKKLIWQEANSRCAFCHLDDVSLLDHHHIIPRANGGSNDPSNLILVCRNCHGRIEDGSITSEQIASKKQALKIIPLHPSRAASGQPIQIQGNVNSSIVGHGNTITIRHGKSRPKIQHPAGTIGASLDHRNYIAHLIKRYHEYRDADRSFGAPDTKFNYAVIHKNIERTFGAQTYFVPIERFADMSEYLKKLIDRTRLGRVNKSRGTPNYSTFTDYVSKLHP